MEVIATSGQPFAIFHIGSRKKLFWGAYDNILIVVSLCFLNADCPNEENKLKKIRGD